MYFTKQWQLFSFLQAAVYFCTPYCLNSVVQSMAQHLALFIMTLFSLILSSQALFHFCVKRYIVQSFSFPLCVQGREEEGQTH